MKRTNFTVGKVISAILWLGLVVFSAWLIEQQNVWSSSGGTWYISHYFYTEQQKKAVTERHLFGEAHVIKSEGDNPFRIYDHPLSEYVIQHAPELESPVKLTGIVYSVDANAARITVANENIQQTFRAGDMLSSGNEKILLILPDEVIIDSNGYYRSLHFKNN
ncbi:type II secretion system protein N [Dickeya dadantii]|uniref:Type II secretion system protein GspC N-terminal domain-containing protein n=1 Tax=Dickeya dadantii (strain 3937) TaxID=198628 RepID=E0SGS5_DICD3|nr:type II secretion system protein N [Dickeya dadantii]ADM98903.1 hypothetical protein Dda3937_03837 [Dickeya dadantii 3937]MCL6405237.1 hypothetical protein [Dickeya dadantii]UAY94776.1 hypothetical protein KTF62_13005 [Dickeya dadantii]